MSLVLVAYSTNSGSTAEVAQAIADELMQENHTVVVSDVADVKDLNRYDAVVVGAPMIFGWHAAARKFVKRHRVELATKKVAFFACAMRLTRDQREGLPALPLTFDPNLVTEPQKPGALNFKERFTTTSHYLQPMLKAAAGVKPISIGFFNGRLEMFRLKWWQAVFVMLVVQATPGDYRDWEFIKSWSMDLGKMI